MTINKETHKIIPVIVPLEILKDLDKVAENNDRSRSNQVVVYIKKGLKEEANDRDLQDNKHENR